MRDRAMQALYLLALDPVAETTADQNSYGFRQGRSCADAIEQCFTSLCHKNPSWVLEGDIKGCFDNISHQWLLDNVPLNKAILHKWLKSGYLEKQVFYDTISGTPQGGIISPTLSNITLDGLERRLREVFPVRGKGSDSRSSSASTFDPLCGRLHHHRTLGRVAENDGQAAGRILSG